MPWPMHALDRVVDGWRCWVRVPGDGFGRGGSSNRENRWPNTCFDSPISGSAALRCRPPPCAFRPTWPARSAGMLTRVRPRRAELADPRPANNSRPAGDSATRCAQHLQRPRPSVSRDSSDRTDKLHRVGTALPEHGVAARARRLPLYQSGQRGRVGAVVGWSAAFTAVGLSTRPARTPRCRRTQS